MDICYFLSLLASRLVQVQISDGIIQGEIVNNEYNDGCPYYSFKGIPYAEPPVGDLRFRAPQPKQPWEGVRDATRHGAPCFSLETNSSVGSEDCLFLNVYSPNIAPEEPFPVMVFIHGGGFYTGSGNGGDGGLGPQFLLRKNVILVTVNYRLEVLGFLSLDTEDIPGNAGMKDQVAALRWVKRNIHNFGGDPDNITLFGESAGGVGVSFHLVSPMSRGLFKRAITQSGALTMWWPNIFRARDRALLIAKELGCNSTYDWEIAQCLKRQPMENLVNQRIPVSFSQLTKIEQKFFYGIVPERQFGNNERFFYGESYDILRNQGVHEGIEVINGYTADEGVLHFLEVDADEVFRQANHFSEYFVPEPFSIHTPLTVQMDIGRRFKDFYMNGRTVSRETLDDFLRYLNMEMFVYGTMSQQRSMGRRNRNKTYFYKFTCVSELNIFVSLLGLEDLFNYRPVVSHADDVPYIFPMVPVNMNSTAFRMVDQVTTLWTNFAKYGDPTPDDSLGVRWLPYTIENQEYLDIGEQLVPGTHPEHEEVEFWENTLNEFLPQFTP